MTPGIWAIALSSISLSAFAQLLMKIGMSPNLAENSMFAVATNPYVAGGFAAYSIGAVLWLEVISRVELSLAYPLVSLAFVSVAVLSWLVLAAGCRAPGVLVWAYCLMPNHVHLILVQGGGSRGLGRGRSALYPARRFARGLARLSMARTVRLGGDG